MQTSIHNVVRTSLGPVQHQKTDSGEEYTVRKLSVHTKEGFEFELTLFGETAENLKPMAPATYRRLRYSGKV